MFGGILILNFEPPHLVRYSINIPGFPQYSGESPIFCQYSMEYQYSAEIYKSLFVDFVLIGANTVPPDHRRPLEITMNTLTGDEGVAVVPENSLPDTFVAQIHISSDAEDVSCQLDSQDFGLEQLTDGEYKLLTKSVFDHEEKQAYNIDIICIEHGQPPLETSKSIQILIEDENEHAPFFLSSAYFTSIPENSPIGTTLIQVDAIDPDDKENGQISYKIGQQENSMVEIDKSSGLITTKSTFDAEEMDHFDFEVIAVDHGNHPLSSTVTVYVSVEDVNDEKAKFSQDRYMFEVYEDAGIGTEVGQVTAYDADGEPFDDVRYSISNDDSGKFNIDSESGIITVGAELDPQETTEMYEFEVVASGQEEWESDTASVSVYVLKDDKSEEKRILKKLVDELFDLGVN